MKIAVVGDIHGLQRQMYEAVSDLDVDMILQVGDFQAVRDQKDLNRLQVPGRYKQLGEYPYYHAQGQVPINTWFIGGNHDNDYWHSAFPQGHELITGLHYLGRAGVKKFDDLVVGWISGNYSPKSYIGTRKKYEYHHMTQEDVQSLFTEAEKSGGVDALLFHVWPSIRDLESDVVDGSVSGQNVFNLVIERRGGVQELADVVKNLQPKYVFAGHIPVPLRFTINRNGSQTRFIGLGEFPNQDSVYRFDSQDL